MLTGCTSVTPQRPPAAVKLAYISLTPDFTHLNDGCHHPCSLSIYESPARTLLDAAHPKYRQGYMNSPALEPGSNTPWPHEAGAGYPAETVKVVCQVHGKVMTDTAGNSSAIWGVVEIPKEHLNAIALQQAESSDPGFGVKKDAAGNVVAAYGFATDLLLGNVGIHPELKRCTPEQNPAGYR